MGTEGEAFRRSGTIVFVVAAFTRLVALGELYDLPLVRTPQLDSFEYFDWARRLASFDFYWPADLPHGPGYPFFLAVLLLVGRSLTAALVVQALAGALTCWFVFRIARDLYGNRAGLAAGLLAALYAPLILIDVSVLAEGLLLLLIVVSVWCAMTSADSATRIVTSAMLLGLAVIVRPTAAVAAPVLLFVVWRKSGRGVRGALIFAVVMALPVLPVTLVNWNKTHSFLPVQAKSGFNFYQGVSPLLTGTASLRPGGAYEEAGAEAARVGLHGAAADRFYVRKALREIRAMPLRFLRLLATKCVWLVQNVELRDSHSFYFFKSQSWLLTVTVPFSLLFGLAMSGVFAAVRERTLSLPVVALLAMFSCTVVGLLVGYRYRMPLVPFLAMFAGLAVARTWERLRERQFKQPAALAAIALCAVAVTFVRDHSASHNFSEEWGFTGQALLSEGKLAETREAYARALEEDPRSVRAYGGLAALALRQSRTNEASSLVQRALAIDDRYPQAHYIAGEIALRLGNPSQAAVAFGQASRILPDWAEARIQLAEALAASGKPREAEQQYQHVIDLFEKWIVGTPDSEKARAWLRLAELRASQHRMDRAMTAVRRSLAVDSTNARAWTFLAMLAMVRRDLELARFAISKASTLAGASDPRIVLARARLEYELRNDAAAMALLNSLPADGPARDAATDLRRAIAEREAERRGR